MIALKSLKTVICVLIIISLIISVHIYKIYNLVDTIEGLSDMVISEYEKGSWENVSENLDKIDEKWKKNRLWVCSTMSTKQIDEIEISLRQSKEYARLSAKEDFIGEFCMFRLCIEHIIMQEGITLNELL